MDTALGRTPLPVAPAGADLAYRRYRGLEEIPGMAAANARLRRHIGIVEPILPEAMTHAYTHLVNSNPLEDCVIVELDGVTAGYARVEWHDLTSGERVYDFVSVVEPAAWGRGVALALARWCEARLREIARGHVTDRPRWHTTYVFNNDPEHEAALGAMGYSAVRWDAEMVREDLDHLPDVPAPEGYEIRTPTEAELPAVHAMSVAAFAEHWGEWESGEQSFAEWVEDPDFRRELVVVAWKGDLPAAYVTNVLEPAPDGSLRGLLDGVATHPDHRRRGLARACIAESLRRLRDTGATSAYLGVDTDNHNRALALYESCGFRRASGSATWRKPFTGEDTP